MKALQLFFAYLMPLNAPALETPNDDPDRKYLERGLHYLFPEPSPENQEPASTAEVSYFNLEDGFENHLNNVYFFW